MSELTYLVFYLLIVRIMMAKCDSQDEQKLEDWLRQFKFETICSVTPNDETSLDPSCECLDQKYLKDLFFSASRKGKDYLEFIDQIHQRVQDSRQFKSRVQDIFHGFVIRISMIILLALAGRWGIEKIFWRPTHYEFKALIDDWSQVASIALLFVIFYFVRLSLPRPWFEISPLKNKSLDWVNSTLFSQEIPTGRWARGWRLISERELLSGRDFSNERRLLLADWEFQMTALQDRAVRKLQNSIPVIEILGGSLAGGLVLYVPIIGIF